MAPMPHPPSPPSSTPGAMRLRSLPSTSAAPPPPPPSPSPLARSFLTATEPLRASLLPLAALLSPIPPSQCHPADEFSPTAPINLTLPGTSLAQTAPDCSLRRPHPTVPPPFNRTAPAAVPCRISTSAPMAPLPDHSATERPLSWDRSRSPASPTIRACLAPATTIFPQLLPPVSPPSAHQPAADWAASRAALLNNPTS